MTPLLANIRPSGKYLMEDFFYAGGLPALLKRAGRPARHVRDHREREDARGEHRPGEGVQRGRHPDHAGPDRREQHPRGAARQPRAGRRGDQAGGGRGAAAPAHRAGRRLRELRRHGRPDRRPGPRHRRELGDRAAQRRPAGRPGHARVGPAADPEEDPREGDPRHGAHLRRADVAARATAPACCTSRRRATSAARWRSCRPATSSSWTCRAAASSSRSTDEELEKRRADWQQPPAKYARGYGALYLEHITQANEGCDFDFLEAGPPIPEPEIH